MNEEINAIGIKTADIYLHFPYITKDEADELGEFLEDEHIEYEGATDVVMNLQKENERLKKIEDNWNTIKNKFCERAINRRGIHATVYVYDLLKKMNELESNEIHNSK